MVEVYSRVSKGRDNECRFTHTGTGRNDDKVGSLPAAEQAVKPRKPAGYTRESVLMVPPFLKILDRPGHQGLHRVVVLPEVGI